MQVARVASRLTRKPKAGAAALHCAGPVASTPSALGEWIQPRTRARLRCTASAAGLLLQGRACYRLARSRAGGLEGGRSSVSPRWAWFFRGWTRPARSRAGGLEGGRSSVSPRWAWFFEGGRGPRGRVLAGLRAGAGPFHRGGPGSSRADAARELRFTEVGLVLRGRTRAARSRAGGLEGGRSSVSPRRAWFFEGGRGPRGRVLAGLRAGAAPFHRGGPGSSRVGAARELRFTEEGLVLRGWAQPARSRAGGLEGGRSSVSPRWAWFFEGGHGPRGRVLAGLRAGAGPFHRGGPGSSRADAARELRFTEAGLVLRGRTQPARSRAGGLEGGRGSVSLRRAWFFEGRVLAGLRRARVRFTEAGLVLRGWAQPARSRAGGLEGGRGSVSLRWAWFFEAGRGPRGRVLAGLRAGAGRVLAGLRRAQLRFTEEGLVLRGWAQPARSRAGGLEGGRSSVSPRWAWFFEGGHGPRGRVLAGLRAGAGPFHRGGPGSSRADAARELRFTEVGLVLRGRTRPARSRAGGLEGGRGSVSLRWAWFFEGGRSPRGRVLAGLRAGAGPFHRGGPGSSRADAAREVTCWRA
eukprot:tig00020816_g14136.t2